MLTRRPAPAVDRPAALASVSIEVAADLTSQLRTLAFAQGQSPEALAQRLLARGLEQEARRARAERVLARLTPRQQEIAWLAIGGRTNRQIAEALVISTETVKTHIANVLERLGLRSKTELRLLQLELGLPGKPGPPTARREQLRLAAPANALERPLSGEPSATG